MAFPQPQRSSQRPRQGVYINNTILGERRTALHVLEEQRDAILLQLDALLAKKKDEREQEAERRSLVQSLYSNGRRAEQAVASLEKGKQRVEQQRAALAERRAALESLADALKKERLRSTTYLFPNDLRTHEMALLHTRLGLATDQRQKLRQLLDVLPLTVTGMGKSYLPVQGAETTSGGVAVAICGLRLPDRIAPDTLQQEQAQQLAMSASLGYMLLLSELLAAYIGGPVLHEGSFQGSTTVLWQQHSFWDRRPAASNDVLPLFVEKGPSMLGAALGVGTGSTAESQTTKNAASGWGPLSLLRRISSNPSPPSPPSPTSPNHKHSGGAPQGLPGLQQQWQQQWHWHQWPHKQHPGEEAEVHVHTQAKHANLDLAFNMLQRTTSSLAHAKVCDLGLTLPASWGPFGWLVMLCAALVQDDECPHSRLFGVLSAAAGCVDAERRHSEQQRQQQAHAAQHYHLHKQRQQQLRVQQAAAGKQQQQQQQQQQSSHSGGGSRSLSRQGSDACGILLTLHGVPKSGADGEAACRGGPGGGSSCPHAQPGVPGAAPGHAAAHRNARSSPAPAAAAAPMTPHAGLSSAPRPGLELHEAGSEASTPQALLRPFPSSSSWGDRQGVCEGGGEGGGHARGCLGHQGCVSQGGALEPAPPAPSGQWDARHARTHGSHHPYRYFQRQEEHNQQGPEEEEEGGWEEVGHHHILPPPPSAEEDVLQYVRALYGDGNPNRPAS